MHAHIHKGWGTCEWLGRQTDEQTLEYLCKYIIRYKWHHHAILKSVPCGKGRAWSSICVDGIAWLTDLLVVPSGSVFFPLVHQVAVDSFLFSWPGLEQSLQLREGVTHTHGGGGQIHDPKSQPSWRKWGKVIWDQCLGTASSFWVQAVIVPPSAIVIKSQIK